MRKQFWVLVAAVAIAAVAVMVIWPRGVKVVVTNTGASPMQNVSVKVTGSSTPLGNLAVGERASVRVRSAGESSVTIQYTDAAGAGQSLDAGCYIESGYSGTIELDIANDKIVRKADATRIGI